MHSFVTVLMVMLKCFYEFFLSGRQYLRGRSDFVRYIAISLTDDSCSELSEELVVAAPLVLDDSYSDIEDMTHWETWTPDPTHAQSCKTYLIIQV